MLSRRPFVLQRVYIREPVGPKGRDCTSGETIRTLPGAGGEGAGTQGGDRTAGYLERVREKSNGCSFKVQDYPWTGRRGCKDLRFANCPDQLIIALDAVISELQEETIRTGFRGTGEVVKTGASGGCKGARGRGNDLLD